MPIRILCALLLAVLLAGCGEGIASRSAQAGEAEDPLAAFEGRRGAVLLRFDANDGRRLEQYELDSPPVFDGLSAAAGRLFLANTSGQVLSLAGE